jgi:hypothetical protein
MVHRRLKSPWFAIAPERYSELRTQLEARYPTLHAVETEGSIAVSGAFAVIHEGMELDWYQIKAVLPDEYPEWPPVAWEIGGRIPRVPDRHVSGDGSLCLAVPEDLWLACEGNFELPKFIEGPVRTFLLRNSLVEQGQGWPHGERAHGADGICQFYGEAIGIDQPAKVLQALHYLSKERVKGHWPCPCGSGKTMRNCHLEAILKLHARIPRRVIEHSIGAFTRSRRSGG